MILQLKVSLRDSKPPIWRRLEVIDSMTFYNLHVAIQLSFEWTNSHLHGFQIRKTNSVQIDDYVTIGPHDPEEDFFSSSSDYDEDKVLLRDVFKKEKDKVWYVYDFGDNWEHEIILEKIVSEELSTFYPRCTKAMRAAPNEDSRFDFLETGIQTEAIDSKIAVEEINELLFDFFSELQSSPDSLGENDGVSLHQEWSKLLEVAGEYKTLQPWKWIDDDQIIVVKDSMTGQYVYCSIMGGGGIEYGPQPLLARRDTVI